MAVILSTIAAVQPVLAEAAIWTDKADYAPGETVVISGLGFPSDMSLTLQICRPLGMDMFPVTIDASGSFTLNYELITARAMEGTYTVQVIDPNSNQILATTTFTDAEQVKVKITSPLNNAWVNTATVAVSGTASTAGNPSSGIQKVEVQVDGGSWNLASGTTSWTYITSALSEGSHTITAKATSNNGNTATDSVTVKVDLTAPSISITSPSDNAWVNTTTVAVTGTASDTGGSVVQRVEVRVDGGSWNLATGTSSWSYTNSALSEGPHTITARATDKAGNVQTSSTITVKVDLTAPSSSVGTLPQYKTSLTFDVSYSVSDGSGSGVKNVQLFYRAGTEGSFHIYDGTFTSSPISFTEPYEGTYQFYTLATDNAGNVEPDKSGPDTGAETFVDTRPPSSSASVTSGTLGSNGWYTSSSVGVTITAHDLGGAQSSGVASITYTLDSGTPVTTPGSSVVITISEEGTHNLSYYATDNAGNQESPSNIATINIDASPPSTTITIGSPKSTSGLTIYVSVNTPFTLDATDNLAGVDQKKYGVDDASTPTAYSGAFTISTQGKHTIYFRSTDKAENVEATKSIAVVVNNYIFTLPSPSHPSPSMHVYTHEQEAAIQLAIEVLKTTDKTGVVDMASVDSTMQELIRNGLLDKPDFSLAPEVAKSYLMILEEIYGKNLERFPSVEGRVWLLWMYLEEESAKESLIYALTVKVNIAEAYVRLKEMGLITSDMPTLKDNPNMAVFFEQLQKQHGPLLEDYPCIDGRIQLLRAKGIIEITT